LRLVKSGIVLVKVRTAVVIAPVHDREESVVSSVLLLMHQSEQQFFTHFKSLLQVLIFFQNIVNVGRLALNWLKENGAHGFFVRIHGDALFFRWFSEVGNFLVIHRHSVVAFNTCVNIHVLLVIVQQLAVVSAGLFMLA